MSSVLLSVHKLVKSYGDAPGRRRRLISRAGRPDRRPARPQRRRQVDHGRHALRPAAPDCRRRHPGWRRVAPGAAAVKRNIGLVPQDLALYEDLSALENLRLFGALYGLAARCERARRGAGAGRTWPTARATSRPPFPAA